jgi:hypothetical protein
MEEYAQLSQQLASHEKRSQERYEWLMEKVDKAGQVTGGHNMEGVNSDKVNINLGEGGGGGGSMAAVIAALGNRNQGNDNAALIAALGNRNDNDGGFGGGGLGLIALLALLGGRGFGRGDDKDCGEVGRVALTQSIMESVADIRAQVPQSALETANALQRAIGELALGTQQGLSNVKDSVQAIGALNLSATQGVAKDVATGTLQTIIAIGNDGDKTRALITNFNNENLQRQLTVAQNALLEDRFDRRSRDVEVNVSQNVNQQQAQLQAQAQLSGLVGLVHSLASQIQNVKANQDIVNLGTMVASGAQTSTNTQVK